MSGMVDADETFGGGLEKNKSKDKKHMSRWVCGTVGKTITMGK